MKVVIQRVLEASVKVDGEICGEINTGLLVLVGFTHDETKEEMQWVAKKICQLRIFNDDEGVMNLSVKDVHGDILLVSQFTLYASTKKGNRPSYINAAKPQQAEQYYLEFIDILQNTLQKPIEKGIFGADMKVRLINDGPVTIEMDTKNKV